MCKAVKQQVEGRGKRWDSDVVVSLMAMWGLLQSRLWRQWWTRLLQHAA